MPVNMKCSGPAPNKGPGLKKYRDAQFRAQLYIGELGYPISMGLVTDAEVIVKKLALALKQMRQHTTRAKHELSQYGRIKA